MAAIKVLAKCLLVILVFIPTPPTYPVALQHLRRQKVLPGLKVVLGHVKVVVK